MYKLNTFIISLNKTYDDFTNYKDLNPLIIKGVNIKTLDKKVHKSKFSYFNNNFLPNKIIGCALAHIKCWKKHILNTHNYTLILEDDFFVEDNSINLRNLIDIYLSHTPKDFDILYLGSIAGPLITNFYKLCGMTNKYIQINDFIAKPEIALGLHSYIISDSGVVKLLNAIEKNKINFHIDTFIQSLSAKKILNTYITIPRIFYQTSTYLTTLVSSRIYCPFFKSIYIDKYVSFNYILNVSLFSILNYNFNVWILFLIFINLFLLIRFIKIKFN
jgi:GR25 family glycosyltransferase involved in LPS biosynthesis